MNKYLSLLIVAFSLCSCNNYKSFGDKEIKVFENTIVHFAPEKKYNPSEKDSEGIVRLVNGRVVLKKINIPKYERTTKLDLKIKLASNGDRWDKAGSCFLIPNESAINLINIAKKEHKFPTPDENQVEKFLGIVSSKDYTPSIELMRFMTPFGVGYFNDKKPHRQPVYIPKYEDYVEWQQDVTDYISYLQGEVWIGVWIDSWVKEGYKIDVTINASESKLANDKRANSKIASLFNTVPYIDGQSGTDLFSRKDLKVNFEIPKGAKNIRLLYTTSGHGGHSAGDEFVKKENIIYVDNQIVKKFVPWRDDCASFRRFNPGSGVWLMKDTAEYISWKTWEYETKVIEERIASSDLSRSNWCPGSMVQPENIGLLDLKPGMHEFKFSIPESQQKKSKEQNFWIVSAYLYWEE
jgi:hypothetical protein